MAWVTGILTGIEKGSQGRVGVCGDNTARAMLLKVRVQDVLDRRRADEVPQV